MNRPLTDLDFVNALREHEVGSLVQNHRDLFIGKDLLEIGSGSGVQLLVLQKICRSARGIETSYRSDRLAEILDYDGQHIPFPDASFDVLYSSHVLEHVANQFDFHREMHRVLRVGGIAVHVMPSASWRFWASFLHYPAIVRSILRRLLSRHSKATPTEPRSSPRSSSPGRFSHALRPRRHGELGSWLEEHYSFSGRAWKKRFRVNGWDIIAVERVHLFVTGHYLLNERLDWRARRYMSRMLGAASTVYIVRKATENAGAGPAPRLPVNLL